jgi:exopolysaccharide biosynthesis polyprenyl glycosylphosphotransferase
MIPDNQSRVSADKRGEVKSDSSGNRETIRVRGRKRKAFFGLYAGSLDALLWLGLYFALTKITGEYNIVTLASVFIPFGFLMISIALVGGYRYRTDFASLRYASEHLIATTCGYFVAAFGLYVVASFGPAATSSRAIFTLSVVAFAVATLAARRLFWFSTRGWRDQGKLLAIVDKDLGPVFYKDYLASKQQQQVEYLASDLSMLGSRLAGEDTPLLKTEAAHLLPQLRANHVEAFEAIIIASRFSHLDHRVMERLGKIQFELMPVYLMETFYENYWHKVPVNLIGPAWPLETEFTLVQHSVYSTIKRCVDFLIALTALIMISPILLLVMLVILILDGRPVIYSQPRTGIHGVPFTLYKFRTMKVGSDKGDGYTREGDSRVSRLGSFLRKSRLDELPQLWNVLKGDMSLIGPRAEWVRLVADYERQIPHYHYRHLVRPGITGWAQVNYPYGASLEDTIEKFSYDLYYIRNFSLRLDAEVVLKTFHTMLFGKGR